MCSMFAVAQKKGVIPMNTKISYLYRDADNYKMHNKCVIAGTLTTEQARTIKDSVTMAHPEGLTLSEGVRTEKEQV